ncbi:hypothetical protein AA098_14425 [Pseudomonas sp. JY-Q]|nr:hypothetical protein AA098_14425 [Pseudomonas sp. JY-Q]
MPCQILEDDICILTLRRQPHYNLIYTFPDQFLSIFYPVIEAVTPDLSLNDIIFWSLFRRLNTKY